MEANAKEDRGNHHSNSEDDILWELYSSMCDIGIWEGFDVMRILVPRDKIGPDNSNTGKDGPDEREDACTEPKQSTVVCEI